MRKVLILAMALLILMLAAAMPASAKKKKPKPKPPVRTERVVEFQYELPALGTYGAGGCLNATPACGNFPAGEGELYIKVELTDDFSPSAPFSLGQDTDPATPTVDSSLGDYCGAMETSVAIQPGYPIVVWPWSFGGPDCPAFSSKGTMKATFSNLP